jgi:hypothetical protein
MRKGSPLSLNGTIKNRDVLNPANYLSPFAHGMQGIVARFDQLAGEQVSQVRLAEMVLFLMMVMVLLVEGLFIFAPTFQTLKFSVYGLVRAEERLERATLEAVKRNKQLEEAFQEAWRARSKTLLPVKLVSPGVYAVSNEARDQSYRVERNPSGAGLVCECSTSELGYICAHVLSATHFHSAWQRHQQRQRPDPPPAQPSGELQRPQPSGAHTLQTLHRRAQPGE